MTQAPTASRSTPGLEDAIDYLIIGHVTVDLTPDGPRLGGTAAYAGLMAHALTQRVGLVTACDPELDITPLTGMAVLRKPSSRTTTFRNTVVGGRRHQVLSAQADSIDLADVPAVWRKAPIVHLAPVADEISSDLAGGFEGAFVGATPQGWWRVWDDEGRVGTMAIDDALDRVPTSTDAAVFSRDDLGLGDSLPDKLRGVCPVVAVTDGPRGADVFWGSHQVHIPAPVTSTLDDTGAGDVFAAVFFVQLANGSSPAHAAEAATSRASASVGHAGPNWLQVGGFAGSVTGHVQ